MNIKATLIPIFLAFLFFGCSQKSEDIKTPDTKKKIENAEQKEKLNSNKTTPKVEMHLDSQQTVVKPVGNDLIVDPQPTFVHKATSKYETLPVFKFIIKKDNKVISMATTFLLSHKGKNYFPISGHALLNIRQMLQNGQLFLRHHLLPHDIKVIDYDFHEKYDIGVIRISPTEKITTLSPLTPSYNQYKLFDNVIIPNYSNIQNNRYSAKKPSYFLDKGHINSLDKQSDSFLVSKGFFAKGGSGSPILDKNLNVIGMANSVFLDKEEQYASVITALKIKKILDFLEGNMK